MVLVLEERKIFKGRAPPALAKIFVTRILMRDLFLEANLVAR